MKLQVQHSRETCRNPIFDYDVNPDYTGRPAPPTLAAFRTPEAEEPMDKPLRNLYLTIYVVAAFIVIIYASVQLVKWKRRRQNLNGAAADGGVTKGVRFSPSSHSR